MLNLKISVRSLYVGEGKRRAPDLVIPLQITEVKPGFQERAERLTRKTIYRISWPKKTIRLFGKWEIPNPKRSSANYIRVPEKNVKIPPDAEKHWRSAEKDTQVQDMAVFLGTNLSDAQVCMILAARVANGWFELYREKSSWRKLGLYASGLRDN